MKVLHVGNMVNMAYQRCKFERMGGMEPDLLMNTNPKPTSDPRNLDKSLNGKFPDWFFFYTTGQFGWKRNIISLMRKKEYDLVHAYAELPIFAYLSRKNFLAHVQGSDIHKLAFSNSLKGILIRKAYKKAKAIIIETPDMFISHQKLKLNNHINLPVWGEAEFFKPIQPKENKYESKFVIFHPTSQIWWKKGNQFLIEGYAKFAKENKDALLLISKSGEDVSNAMSLVEKLGISNQVEFIEPVNHDEMEQLYAISDVVADQFVWGALGGIGREAISCERPLLTDFDVDGYMDFFGDTPPAANAKTPDEICHQLEKLKDKNYRKNLSLKCNAWVKTHYKPISFANKMKFIYNSILNDQKIEDIRNDLNKIS